MEPSYIQPQALVDALLKYGKQSLQTLHLRSIERVADRQVVLTDFEVMTELAYRNEQKGLWTVTPQKSAKTMKVVGFMKNWMVNVSKDWYPSLLVAFWKPVM
ncbi:MAG: hypothetical protein ALECFALPRED_000015 [Alectoria fallacina]|uniref:Uncharacterized protein n=1 Tax=Alectoria fallacina TaxID=1903189 RepID=A0A8H3I4B5_9LECA|nr:MAG: hypothetical protein ALECFALPRED_000015 [Alectoria fallacina]